MAAESGNCCDYEFVVGTVKKVREKNSSLASSVGLSVDERYLVVTADYLHCFRKEPAGSFVFQHQTIHLRGADGEISASKSNNQQPYASVQLGSHLSFCRAYDTSDSCRVFELQDDRKENAERVYAFEAASGEEMRERWLGPIGRRHEDILRQTRLEKMQKRMAGTPEYVKIYDSDGKRGQQACREYFRSMLNQCYPEASVAQGGKRLWDQHLGAAGELLELLEQVSFETTVAPVEAAPEHSNSFGAQPAAAQTERPLGRTDVLALLFEEANRTLVARFRPLLFDGDTVRKLEAYDTPTPLTAAGSDNSKSLNQGSNSEKAAFLGTLPLSSEIVTDTGLGELHTLVAFIVRYQNRLRALQATTSAKANGNGKMVSLPTHCEVFDYLPCVYERYINGITAKGPSQQSTVAPAANGAAPRRPSVTRRSAPAPPPASVAGTGIAAGDIASSDGAGFQLQEHCNKVWTGIRADPADAIARHIDGTFYTEGPTAVWGCLHQHIALGQETNATILRVMIAEKIAVALSTLFSRMGVFVTPSSGASSSGDSGVEPTLSDVVATDAAVREVEVEFLCAVTNDCGIHLDEVFTVVGGFSAIEGVKKHVDGAFDVVSTALMRCATTSLRRLVRLVLADVEAPFAQVFTHAWLGPLVAKTPLLPAGAVSTVGYDEMLSKAMKEGATSVDAKPVLDGEGKADEAAEAGVQIHTILHTLGDYLEDFRVYIVQFWYDKFAAMLFTQAVNRYIDAVISRTSERIASTGAMNRLGSIMGSTAPAVPLCAADARALAKIRSDMAALQQYISRFNRRTSSQGGVNPNKYTELLQFFMLVLGVDAAAADMKETELGKAVAAAAQTAPFALVQLKQFLSAALICRPDIKVSDRETLLALAKAGDSSALASDAASVRDRLQRQQQLEQAVGLVLALNNFVGTSTHVAAEEGADAIKTQGQGLLTSSLSALRSLVSSVGSKGSAALRRNSGGSVLIQASTATKESAVEKRGLSDDVQRLIREHEAAQLADAQAAEKAEAEASAALEAGFLHCTGTLDKRKEGTALWQKRFLRIQSRRVEATSGGAAAARLAHSLLWYKRQEGISLGSAELADMTSFVVTQFARPLEYMPASDSVRLVGGAGPAGLLVSRWRPDATESEIDERSNEDSGYFVVRVVMRGRGQSFDLRGSEVDVFVRWVNALATGAGLSYDESACEWSRSGRENLAATAATWRKQGVLAQKEETAMSAIQMAKAQQRKEKAEREKLQQSKPGSAAALIAETKLAQLSTSETMNPLLAPSTAKPAAAEFAAVPDVEEESPPPPVLLQGKESGHGAAPAAPPLLPSRKTLAVSTSVDSFQAAPSPIMSPNGGMKLSLQLPTAMTAPVVVDDESPVKLAPKAGVKASSTTNLPAAAAGGGAAPHSYSASLKGEPVSIEIASPRRRLSSADMPVPRRSSLKGFASKPQLAFEPSSLSLDEQDEDSERYSRSSRGSSFSSVTSVDMSSVSSSDSLGSVGSTGRRKSVSFTASEVREYEPRAPPEETLNSPSRQEPQRYQLESVKFMPPAYKGGGRKQPLTTTDGSDYDSNGRRKQPRPEEEGCCACM